MAPLLVKKPISQSPHQIGNLLSTRELVDLPTEVALWGPGASTQPLVSGLSCVDAQLKVDRAPIRTMAAAAVKCKRADARANAKGAKGGGPSPQPLDVTEDGVTPLAPVAGEAAGGQLNLKTQKLEDLDNPFFNPVIMTFGSRLACEWTCVAG